MRKIWMILRREYLTVVRNKMFWIGTLLIPLGIVAMIVVSIGAQLLSPKTPKTIVLVEDGTTVSDSVERRLSEETFGDGTPKYPVERVDPDGDLDAAVDEMKPRLLGGDLYAVVAIGPDRDAKNNFRMFRKSVGDPEPVSDVRRAISDTVIGQRLEERALEMDREELDALLSGVRLESFEVQESGDAQKKGAEIAMISTFMFIIVLFVALYFYGYQMARGVIQEKANKVMEVLLGSVSANQLMAGKILGIGLVGLTQMAIYGGFGLIVQVAVGRFAMRDSGQEIPEALVNGIQEALSFERLFYLVVFFLLGYFLFTSLFAIVGAVCSTEQDAQQLQMPVMMCLMIPYISTFFFVRHPDSMAAIVMSFIPVFTPMIMFMRISVLEPPFWQIALSILIMIVTIVFVMRVAAKVFRVGTLMTGKRPSLPEIWRWARS